jgi:Rps23 Pro-64 3,4-dihydroxylase Tpa1-like proline 4-hydroxylase
VQLLTGELDKLMTPAAEAPFIDLTKLRSSLQGFAGNTPFDHCLVDGFLTPETAQAIESEFLAYDSPKWYRYLNAIEDKKALNDWNSFPRATYRLFQYLNSPGFVRILADAVGVELVADSGLHGGGWHCHGLGGNLNPHLDYSIHPKLGLQRKLNIIVYVSRPMRQEYGGHLGLWAHDPATRQPGELIREIEPQFNRAVIFDTTQNSWHGMSRPLTQPEGIYRQSLAVYYLCQPGVGVDPRGKALFAPREEQKGDPAIKDLIALRSGVDTAATVYR